VSFPRYPAYKDSGIDWLGRVPDHWRRARFKEVFEERHERSLDGHEELLSVSAYFGVKPRAETRDEGEHLSRAESLEGYKKCEPEDLVMNIMLAWNRGLGFSWTKGIVSPAYSVFSLIDESAPKFLDYLVRSDEYIQYFKAYSAGVIDSRLRLYPEVFSRLACYLPRSHEQSQIARFLDHETAKIDALIQEQQRLIELLKEKRQAIISHAVTKGLDPSVPMKDSGVEWLGEVPEHWQVCSLRRLLSGIEQGWSPECSNYPADQDQWGVLKAGAVNNGLYREGENKALPSTLDPRLDIEVKAGDLIMCRASGSPGLIGSVAHIKTTRSKLLLSDKLFRLVVGDRAYSEYVALMLGSQPLRTQIVQHINGAEGLANNLSKASVKGLTVTLPPYDEQIEVVEDLRNQLSQIQELLTVSTEAVVVLQERRTALISAAVTGKIDVRDWQRPVDERAFNEEAKQAGMETTA